MNFDNKIVLWIHKYGWIIQSLIAIISLIVAIVMYEYTKELLSLMKLSFSMQKMRERMI